MPASGKSTFARKLVQEDAKWKRINKDDFRMMLHNGKWSVQKEKDVLKVRDSIMRLFLEEGYNVVVDDTNFAPHHIKNITKNIKDLAEVEVKFFDIPLGVAIDRDLQRERSVGKDVITKMYNTYIAPTLFPPVQQDKSLPKAVIFDVDGTLAKMCRRSPYDVEKCVDDYLHANVHELIPVFKSQGYTIIVCSGRKEEAKEATKIWFSKNNLHLEINYKLKGKEKGIYSYLNILDVSIIIKKTHPFVSSDLVRFDYKTLIDEKPTVSTKAVKEFIVEDLMRVLGDAESGYGLIKAVDLFKQDVLGFFYVIKYCKENSLKINPCEITQKDLEKVLLTYEKGVAWVLLREQMEMGIDIEYD